MLDEQSILDVPLSSFLKPQIALSLQHVLRIYTVGNLMNAWELPREQKRIEQLFDSPDQARHAVSVCANWLGFESYVMKKPNISPWLGGSLPIQLPINTTQREING